MDSTIPEEIREKLKIIEKEMVFSEELSPPGKKWIISGSIFCLLAIVVSIGNKNFYEIAFYLLLGFIYFAIHLENKKTYQLNSAACDIIKYYRDKEANKEGGTLI